MSREHTESKRLRHSNLPETGETRMTTRRETMSDLRRTLARAALTIARQDRLLAEVRRIAGPAVALAERRMEREAERA